MLKEIAISRFRGIRNLAVSDLGSVNIFVGANGAGKTTFLEAASIAANPVSPNWLMTLSQWREMPTAFPYANDWLQSYFYDLASDPAELTWIDDHQSLSRLVISPINGNRYIDPEPGIGTGTGSGSGSASSQSEDQLGGFELHYFPANGEEVVTNLSITPNGFHVTGSQKPGVKGIGAFFIHARRSTSLRETATMLTSAAEMRTDEIIYTALRRVDSRIIRLIPGVRGREPIVLADVGLPRLIPTNVLGDGFSRVLLMLTGAVTGRNRLLLVDDIDSGLHNSVMAGVWKSLIELSSTRSVQILCTTHSEEMLQNTLEAFSEQPDMLRVFRIDRGHADEMSVQKYGFNLFRGTALAGMDVR